MMIKLIIFDLDGVLYDSKNIHFKALNYALKNIDEKYEITLEEHLNIYDGLPTIQKLNNLTDQKKLPKNLHNQIWKEKQVKTNELLEEIKVDKKLIKLIKKLKSQNLKIACCSNSIEETVVTILKKLGIFDQFDLIISNEKVNLPKPHPEMFWKAISKFEVLPSETLIVEDSAVGRLAARESGANTIFVNSRNDLDKNFLNNIINFRDESKRSILDSYTNKELNVLIPLAGMGSRFSEQGYVFPKPLIEVLSKPMIQLVYENLNIDAKYIFIVQKEHVEKYNIDKMLKLISSNCEIVQVDGITEGAACTTLLAKEYINNDKPLIISNSDQFVIWNPRETMYSFTSKNFDGGILTFESSHPKWSYAKVDEYNLVTEVAEKIPISKNATVGIYYWKKGSDYVKYSEEMIKKDIRVNGEFYVCPVYNQAIDDGKKITIKNVEKMWGLGTPEDLNNFINEFNSI